MKTFMRMALSAFSVCVLALSLCCTAVSADDDVIAEGISGQVEWKINRDGLLTVTGSGDWEVKMVNIKELEKLAIYNTDIFGASASDFEAKSADTSGFYWLPPWYEYRDRIRSANVKLSGNKNASFMFWDCQNLEYADMRGSDAHDTLVFDNMFYGCEKLKSINWGKLNTGNAFTFLGMFYGCRSLAALDLSGFDTRSAVNFDYMFCGCSSLKELDLKNFYTP